MGQIKIFGLASDRFFPMEPDNFYFPKGRPEKYTIIEISIFETPKHNWGIRGLPGDELQIDYKVNV
ncbi:hypothetical protein FACS189413_10620 [Bacteroidia bacterium]|nr:hypothetical protein FACS189413_10620 [Bacteroidia bacterium]